MNRWTAMAAVLAAAILAAGCDNAVRTPGTAGLKPSQMAMVLVVNSKDERVLLFEPKFHVDAITIDALEYPVRKDAAFWITPGRHEFGTFLHPRREDNSPDAKASLDAKAGHTYTMRPGWYGGASGGHYQCELTE